MRIGVGVAAAVLLALAGAPHAAAGGTVTVTRTDDPAPDGCTPTDCSLREAVLAADADPDFDAILLPGGHFRLTIAGPGEDAAATGDLDLTGNVAVMGSGARLTVIDAQGLDRAFDVASGVTAEITDLTVTGGQAPGDGGGIRNRGDLSLTRDAFLGNRAQGSGGGIEDEGSATIRQSLIARNLAPAGGGLHVGGASVVTATTISGNLAGGPGETGHGGGIDGLGGSSLSLESVTLTDNQSYNSALTGGGIADAPYASAINTILANNRSYEEDQSASALNNCAEPLDSGGFNLSDSTECGLDQPGDVWASTVLLGPLGDNGGPTDTQAVLAGSAALDSGVGMPACSGVDQRGVSRPRGSTCDIGAYELAPPLATTTAGTAIGFTTATMTGTVDPSLRQTTVWFEYGRTSQYGSGTPGRIVGSGNQPISFAEPLAGLRQGATYHYRLVAENSEGRTYGADQSFTTLDRQKPVLTLLRIVPGLFHRKNGVTFSFTLSENATVTLRFDHVLRGVRSGKRCVKITRRNRRHRPCTRYLPVAGSVVLAAAEGKSSTHFDARVGAKLLTFGAYRLRATPRDPSGNVGKTVLAAFRVLR